MMRMIRVPARLPARLPPPRTRRPLSTPTGGPSKDWRVWAAFESRDEVQKVRLASLLFDLEAMAIEKQPSASPAGPAVDEPASSLDTLDMVRLPKALTPGAALDTFEQLSHGDHLHPECLLRLLQQVSATLAAEPPLLDLQAVDELLVVGDLHGSMESLHLALRACDAADRLAPGRSLLFNGDFVDRGTESVEVLASLLLLKHAHPTSVWLLRGNHEDGSLATVYGFRDEVRDKYPAHAERIWVALLELFGSLPVAAHTASAFIVHGGLPSAQLSLQQLRDLPPAARRAPSVLRHAAAAGEAASAGGAAVRGDGGAAVEVEVERGVALLRGLLWSDPVAEERGFEPNTRRGDAGSLYGTDAAREWLLRHGLRHLVRSHELVADGWERIESGAGTSVFTVFSCADYPNGEGYNRGAVLCLERGAEPRAVEFSLESGAADPAAGWGARQQRSLAQLVLSHRHQLRETFEAIAPGGRVDVQEWCRVMRATLGLDLEWELVQPDLAATVKRAAVAADGSATLSDTGLVDYCRFLDRIAARAASGSADGASDAGGAPSAALEAMHRNAAQMMMVFKFLDQDGSGAVDGAEFRAGVELLNSRLPPEQAMADVDALFESIDLDSNGHIEFEEFCAVFKDVSPAARRGGPGG
jgi:diadenosine tetraphosphatase ApaH/serine/threonine PP2A family protein phosphatase